MKLLLLSFCLIALAIMSGCGTNFGPAYGNCMAQRGLQELKGVPGQVDGILSSGSPKDASIAALEALTGRAGVDAVTCAVMAWLGAPARGRMTPEIAVGREAGTEWLARHRAARRYKYEETRMAEKVCPAADPPPRPMVHLQAVRAR